MADDFIAIDIVGLKELQAKLKGLPEAAQDAIVDDVSKYYLNVLREYPPRKYVSRMEAYGQTFFSDKQRRYFFAALADGRIQTPYNRTQALSKGWKQIGRGKESILANEMPYADLVMGEGQSRMSQKIGWKTLPDIIKERWAKAMEIADAAVKKAIKKMRLS